MMASGDHDQVEAGIQSLGLAGSADAVEPLAKRMRQGLPPDLLETAIYTMMALGQKEAGPMLFALTHHRRPQIRKAAIEALAAIQPDGAEGVLTASLSDKDKDVRAAAARALGDIGASGAIEVLFHALDKGNNDAGSAIGRVVKASDVDRLLSYLGRIPLHTLGGAIAEVLKRKDIKTNVKLKTVARLQELGTPEVKDYFGDLMSTSAADMPQPVNKAILRAMSVIAG